MFGAFGAAPAAAALTFVSAAAQAGGIAKRLGISKRTAAVAGTRGITKAAMKLNDALPTMDIDPEIYEVRADGRLLICEPAQELAMAQRYFLF